MPAAPKKNSGYALRQVMRSTNPKRRATIARDATEGKISSQSDLAAAAADRAPPGDPLRPTIAVNLAKTAV